MREVGITRAAQLIAMAFGGNFVGATNHPGVFRGAVFAQLGEQLVQASVKLALGTIAMKVQRYVTGKRHSLVYASRDSRATCRRVPQGKRRVRPRAGTLENRFISTDLI